MSVGTGVGVRAGSYTWSCSSRGNAVVVDAEARVGRGVAGATVPGPAMVGLAAAAVQGVLVATAPAAPAIGWRGVRRFRGLADGVL